MWTSFLYLFLNDSKYTDKIFLIMNIEITREDGYLLSRIKKILWRYSNG